MTKDARRHDRLFYGGPVQVLWKDGRGQEKFARAKCLNISESGMELECPEPIEVRSYVVIRADRIKFTGNASVRHCSRYAGKYHIGFEFSSLEKTITQALTRDLVSTSR